jgi:hypothetical protein
MANKRGEQGRDVLVMKTKFVSKMTLLWDSAGAIVGYRNFSDSIVASIPPVTRETGYDYPSERHIMQLPGHFSSALLLFSLSRYLYLKLNHRHQVLRSSKLQTSNIKHHYQLMSVSQSPNSTIPFRFVRALQSIYIKRPHQLKLNYSHGAIYDELSVKVAFFQHFLV